MPRTTSGSPRSRPAMTRPSSSAAFLTSRPPPGRRLSKTTASTTSPLSRAPRARKPRALIFGEVSEMSVAFIYGPNSPRADLTGTVAFYEQNAAVRSSFDQASEWTGISVSQLLRKRELPAGDSVMRLHSISLTAAMLGIQDALCDLGVRPDLVGGGSLGGVVSSAAAGALTRRQQFVF